MTEERSTMDTGVETDAVVTKAYRDTTDERAPDSLNRAILDQAAKAARPRYSRLIQWTRPMAWAATVMLSVAIVLQLTEDIIPEVEAPADAAAMRLEEAVLPASEATNAAPKIEALRSSAKQVAPSATAEARQRSEQSKADLAEQELAAPELGSAYSESSEFGLVNTSIESPGCDKSVTAAAETWLQCIADLEDAGRGDIAREQRELFTAAYPDFDTP